MVLNATKNQDIFLMSGYLKDFNMKLELQNMVDPSMNFKVIGYIENAEDVSISSKIFIFIHNKHWI